MNIISLYTKHKETAGNFLWKSLQVFCKGSALFLIYFIAAKLLTLEEFGVFNYLSAFFTLLLIACDFGFSSSASKFTAEYKIKLPSKVPRLFTSTSVPIFAVYFFIAVMITIFGKTIFNKNYLFALMLLPYLILVPLTNTLDSIYRGLKQFKRLSFAYIISSLSSIFISFFLIKNYGMKGALFSLSFLYLLSLIILLFFTPGIISKFDPRAFKDLSKYALFIGFSSLSYFLYSKIDILIMKQFNFIVEIGYYGISDKIFVILFVPAIVLGQVIAPDVTKYITLKDYKLIHKKFFRYLGIAIFAAIPFALALHFVLPPLFKIILPRYYSSDFLYIWKILLILLPFKIWGAILVHGFIIPSGKVKITMILTGAGGILNIIFDYIFIKAFGFIGVFFTTLIIHSCVIVLSAYIYYRKINTIEPK